VSIKPQDVDEALNQIGKAEDAHADFIEVRLDSLKISRNLSDLASHTEIPLIATNKLLMENGGFSGTEAERQQTLENAAKCGFQYVDVNLATPKLDEVLGRIRNLEAKPIVSYHNYTGPSSNSDLEKILKKQIDTHASICKIVTTAKKPEDNLSLLNFVSQNSAKTNLVCFCMGEAGKISRLLSPVYGAFFTFASLERCSETAAGQISIGEMKLAYEMLGFRQ
jgi:3-dehydroquinate dehydratase type I